MSDPFSLADFLPYQLAYISERVSQRLSVEYERRHGLTVAEWRVLVNLQHLGTASVRDIQVFTNLEKSRVSRAVGRLEVAGFVEKQPSAEDARLVEIALTAAGQNVLSDIIPAAKSLETRLMTGVSEHHMQTFLEVVQHLHAALDADPDARPRFERKDG